MSDKNIYSSNNHILTGSSIPTEGTFKVGDIIVNNGANAAEEPMWICIEAGTPGVWKAVGAGEDLSGLQTQNKDSLVAAINELFQSANNGKELIASAIGEPLSSEDTFQAMSDDINGLLATFKTNMMNNGVAIDSGDKFKALIDKIATLADSEGKGIKYAEGSLGSYSCQGGFGSQYANKTFNVNIDFEPTVLFIHFDEISFTKYGGYSMENYYNFCVDVLKNEYTASKPFNAPYYSGNFNTKIYMQYSSKVFTLYTSGSADYNNITYYAIGVGEEDTTLRDSLASILEEEGVEVTDEDDMASLISKVDQEFDKQVVPAGNAVATNVLSGKTFINSTGATVTGTMTNQGSKTVTPSASNQTLPAGYYSGITISGDTDLIAANIVAGKNIFGVNGNATAASLGGMNFATGVSAPVKFHSGLYGVKITGLSFKPSVVLVVGETEYYYGYIVNMNGFQKVACASTNSYNGFTYKDNPSDTDNYMGCYDDGFKVGVLGGSVYSNFRWYAFG